MDKLIVAIEEARQTIPFFICVIIDIRASESTRKACCRVESSPAQAPHEGVYHRNKRHIDCLKMPRTDLDVSRGF